MCIEQDKFSVMLVLWQITLSNGELYGVGASRKRNVYISTVCHLVQSQSNQVAKSSVGLIVRYCILDLCRVKHVWNSFLISGLNDILNGFQYLYKIWFLYDFMHRYNICYYCFYYHVV